MATIPEALAIAVQHHQAGRLPNAEQLYRQILAVEPNQPDALHLLGTLALQMGKHEIGQFLGVGIQIVELIRHSRLEVIGKIESITINTRIDENKSRS